MRLVLAALALVACKKHGDAPQPASAPAFDQARCEQQIGKLGEVAPSERVRVLLDACPVCGDWKPLLEWNTRRTEGGPTQEAILDRMKACDAWCESKAKDFFAGTLDNARGVRSRVPWKQLAEVCKDKVSAVPDGRFESAPYFALDRIGRKLGGHVPQLAQLELVLPPISATGSVIDVPEADGAAELAPGELLLTVLGDQLYVTAPPTAHLTANGVQLAGTENYPGHAATPADFASPHAFAVIAANGMPAKDLLALLDKTGDAATLHLAVKAKNALFGWPAIATVPLDRHAHVDDKSTVQDLVRRL